MGTVIHPTAVIEPGATLGENVSIGAFSMVGHNVTLGDNVTLHNHVNIAGHTMIGAGTEVFPFASLGCAPQHTRYAGEDSILQIGAHNIIREHVTMHPGTAIDKMKTVVGDHGYFMASTHVAHDCVVGDHAIFANNATIGGHVEIGSHVMLGGFASVQQWCRVGDHAMVGSQTAVDKDVIPYAMAVGNRAVLTGINVIGLSRRGFSQEQIDQIRAVFHALFKGEGLFNERRKAVTETHGDNADIALLLAFIEAAGKNGICHGATR